MAELTTNLPLLPGAAHVFLAALPMKSSGATLVTLSGELGAGKTSFVQAAAKNLGVKEPVQSPTYVLMKKYATADPRFHTLIHIDAYRLADPKEFLQLNPDEFLKDARSLVMLEWPERAAGMLPPPDKALSFSSEGLKEGERRIKGI